MSTLFGFTDPLADLLDMQRQMDLLMDTFATATTPELPLLTTTGAGRPALATAPARGGRKARRMTWRPRLDVCETNKALIVHAELPGCNKEDIKLSVVDNRLVLEGRKRTHAKQEGENWVRKERFKGTFHRTLPLPSGVDANQIQANYENGVLEVIVPKPESTTGKKLTIDIKSAEPGAKSELLQPAQKVREEEEKREEQPQEKAQKEREQPQEEKKEEKEEEEPEEKLEETREQRLQQRPEEKAPEEREQPQEKEQLQEQPSSQPQELQQAYQEKKEQLLQEPQKTQEQQVTTLGESTVFIGGESAEQKL